MRYSHVLLDFTMSQTLASASWSCSRYSNFLLGAGIGSPTVREGLPSLFALPFHLAMLAFLTKFYLLHEDSPSPVTYR